MLRWYANRELRWIVAVSVVTVVLGALVLPGGSSPPSRLPAPRATELPVRAAPSCPPERACGSPVAGASTAGATAGPPVAAPGAPRGGPTAAPGPAGNGFIHPGVLVSRPQLDFVRDRLAAGEQPWTAAFAALRADPYASLSWQPRPRAVVECGSSSHPDNGCSDERRDAMAAYADALMWYLTGDPAYARQAITIADAWAATLRSHTNTNAPIQAGWSGATFARAGELIRWTYSDWNPAQQTRFATMLRTVYLPMVLPAEIRKNGNHALIELDAATGIAVFLDDRAAFDRAVASWRDRLPAYVYLREDGELPPAPAGSGLSGAAGIIDYWQGQSSFVDGLTQETCRDFGHAGWGLEAATHVAATAWIQGIDLYAESRSRITAALEFHAAYELGAPVPSWLCGGVVHSGLGPVVELAYNHYHNRSGVDLPGTARLVERGRPAGANYFLAWETLTNADNPYA